eukprot:bmy_04768T0
MLCIWLHHYPEHFHQPPAFPRLKMFLAYMELSMPGSDLEQQAHLLLAQLEHLEPPEAEGDGEEDSGWVMGGEWGGEGAGPHRTGLPEAGTGPLRRLRSLFPWTAVWEDFLGVASWIETSLIGSEKFPIFGGTGKAVLLMIFSLLGATAPALEQALETYQDLKPATPLLPTTAPEPEQAQATAIVEAQEPEYALLPVPQPELEHGHALALI